jgi:hypothetical protein
MNGQICVGGILTKSGKYVRILDEDGNNQPEDTPLDIRQVWEIEYINKSNCTPPHVEDILVLNQQKKGVLKQDIKIADYLLKTLRVKVWKGAPDNLFDGLIKWTSSGSGYIDNNGIPSNSVGFWIADKDLSRNDYNGIRYKYTSMIGWRTIKFVGFQTPTPLIPSGTLIRVSLARWWQKDSLSDKCCYLQLSGWYDR